MTNYDLIVIGSGPAGRRAAIQAAKLQKSVLVIDNRSRVGGVSVHTGTIPSKTLRETVLNLSGWRERSFYGASYRVKNQIVPTDLAARLGKTLEYEIAILEHQFARNSVHTAIGQAHFTGPNSIAVTGNAESYSGTMEVRAEKILIAVGTEPLRPEHIPFNASNVLDSDDFVRSPRVPRSLTVVGAGVIGLEYATIFSALDIPVTLIEPRSQILEFMDSEIVENFAYQLRDRGVSLRLNSTIEKIEFNPAGAPICILDDGRQITSDMVLYTAGRAGATSSLNLEACGLTANARGLLKVDKLTFQTCQPHIYAAGDVIGFPSLASTSMEQGRAAACHAFDQTTSMDPQSYPMGIYTVPELSSVGLNENQAREQGIRYECGIARLRETSRGHIMGLQAGILKLIFDADSLRLLGAHIVGEGATELIHIGQLAINLGGTLDYFVDSCFNYPTLAEAYKVASLDAWNRLRRSPILKASRKATLKAVG